MKPKVFLISFHKAGTRSFHNFMLLNGYTSIHYPRLFKGRNFEDEITPFRDDREAVVNHLSPIIEAADAHCDVPWPGLYKELLARYTNAKFVLGMRDPDSWADSVAHHWSLDYLPRRLNNYEYCQYSRYLGKRAGSFIFKSDCSLLVRALYDHNAEVQRVIPRDQLFIFRLGEKEVGFRLAKFLGCENSHEMPILGSRKKTQFERLKKSFKKSYRARSSARPII